VAKGGVVTTFALERDPAPSREGEGVGSAQERLIIAAINHVLGEVPVILCGSRAAGTSTTASDYDLLVAIPRRRIPFALHRLGELATTLTDELAAPVSVNPLPLGVLRRQPNLFLWKLRREARVLLPEHGFELSVAGAPPLDDDARFSYLMTALLHLLSVADLAQADDRRERAVRKALLHVAQLRLWSKGAYPLTLEEALEQLDDERIAEPASRAGSLEAWNEARSLVVAELAALRPRRDLLKAVRTNARYAVLAALRGRLRVRAAASLRPIDRRLADVAVGLAAVDGPRFASWPAIRDLVLAEWPDAHPLLAQ
jgi:predicted nucleotidyltransferase